MTEGTPGGYPDGMQAALAAKGYDLLGTDGGGGGGDDGEEEDSDEEDVFGRIRKLPPDAAREKGKKAFQDGDYDKAIRYWLEYAPLHFVYSEVLVRAGLAMAYMKKEDYHAAERHPLAVTWRNVKTPDSPVRSVDKALARREAQHDRGALPQSDGSAINAQVEAGHAAAKQMQQEVEREWAKQCRDQKKNMRKLFDKLSGEDRAAEEGANGKPAEPVPALQSGVRWTVDDVDSEAFAAGSTPPSDGKADVLVSSPRGAHLALQDWGLALSRTVLWAMEQLALEGPRPEDESALCFLQVDCMRRVDLLGPILHRCRSAAQEPWHRHTLKEAFVGYEHKGIVWMLLPASDLKVDYASKGKKQKAYKPCHAWTTTPPIRPWLLKLSTDRTYRLMHDKYVLLTMGINVKKFHEIELVDGAFASQWRMWPIAWVMTFVQTTTCSGTGTFKGIEAGSGTGFCEIVGGITKLLLQHVSPERRRDLLPCILQWCHISKLMPRVLFHMVWTSLFAWMEAEGDQGAAAALKQQYFAVDEDFIQAPWRSVPDRIMPGTDVGSAPQESWHTSRLKVPLQQSWKQPYTLAQALSSKNFTKQRRGIRETAASTQKTFQDWPTIGQFTDQHSLRNETALAKEGLYQENVPSPYTCI
ncbi:hypothetical protein AK812_SmicGene33986 [Symbiodinium microadriaticum]|uniref:Uncharacterized protein n=1 Tax=Symbiodinium microadriaticum TaxID=2951 RepID=A0A1Q9CQB3_SYMMI|nr:hypothetical protein AK812_SmicGene33986 [Symbiodinium microadriaticum]